MDLGDTALGILFEAIGRALSKWEEAEAEFATLYATFKGEPFDFATIEGFGEVGVTFSRRMAALEEAAADYFVCKCDQENEGDLAAAVVMARELSKDRHRIAHGVVIETIVSLFDPETRKIDGFESRWLLQAPVYAVRNLKFKSSSGFASKDIDKMAIKFGELADKAENLSMRFMEREKLLAVLKNSGDSLLKET